jgi:hypothetical protein
VEQKPARTIVPRPKRFPGSFSCPKRCNRGPERGEQSDRRSIERSRRHRARFSGCHGHSHKRRPTNWLPKHAASDNHRRSTTRRSSLSSSETPWVSDKRRASAARRWHSSIKWLLCSTVTSASLFRLFYDFIASGSSPQRFVPHGRPVKRRPRGLGSVTQNRAPHVGLCTLTQTHSH